jgi:hypothetical protein
VKPVVPFKICPKCAAAWETRDGFLDDAEIHLNGYQASIENLESGLFLFTHTSGNCGTTMSVSVRMFDDLYTGCAIRGKQSAI